jgi:hypothetical protein
VCILICINKKIITSITPLKGWKPSEAIWKPFGSLTEKYNLKIKIIITPINDVAVNCYYPTA